MDNKQEKDYSGRTLTGITALILVLIAVSFIPPQSFGGIKLRRANILSDIMTFDDAAEGIGDAALFDEDEFHVDMRQVAEQIEATLIEADTAPRPIQTTFMWHTGDKAPARRQPVPDSALINPSLTPVELFSAADSDLMRGFYDSLLCAERPVRIAVLGDSFIEGDIMTADLREKLQTAYGGGGTGFAPMASPLTAFRRSVKTQSKGWTSYNIMQRKSAPAAMRDNFYISGWVCQPSAGASTRWESTTFRRNLDNCTSARVIFISPADSKIELILNDTLRHEFEVEGAAMVRQAVVEAERINSLTFKVLSGNEGFIGYGAVFEAQGVVVDNYSVRSNNGQAMFWTNPSVNAQINAFLGYDLIILQYGLNIMQTGVHHYSSYADQIEKMISFVRQCFPTAAVMVMGVSDRSVKTDAGYEPMDAIEHMLKYQRRAAANAGAAFWPTCDAMRAMGGMERFVSNGWAGKDFTHINYAGGSRVAWSLVDAINAGAVCRHRHMEAERIRKQQQQAVLDSIRLHSFSMEMRSGVTPLNTAK